jgi:hypothetical protein
MWIRAFVILASSCTLPLGAQGPDPRFRSSLSATLLADRPNASCATISLAWRPRPGAMGYRGFVSSSKEGEWHEVPSVPPCGVATRANGATSAEDTQATDLTTRRSLFYRVLAFGAKGPIDTTDVVPVELPPRTPLAAKP